MVAPTSGDLPNPGPVVLFATVAVPDSAIFAGELAPELARLSVAEREPGAVGRNVTFRVVDSPGFNTTGEPSLNASPNIFASAPVI